MSAREEYPEPRPSEEQWAAYRAAHGAGGEEGAVAYAESQRAVFCCWGCGGQGWIVVNVNWANPYGEQEQCGTCGGFGYIGPEDLLEAAFPPYRASEEDLALLVDDVSIHVGAAEAPEGLPW